MGDRRFMKHLLFLALLAPIHGNAAPIEWSQQDLYSSDDLVNDCVAGTNEKMANECKRIIGTATAELPAWEACTSFQLPEHKALSASPKNNALIKKSMERVKSCVPIVNGKSFAPNALDICSLSTSPGIHQSCLKGIADGSFLNAAFSLCTEDADKYAVETFGCLYAIKDKSFSASELNACSQTAPQNRATCFRVRGVAKNELKECSQKLAEVQSKIESLASKSSEKNLKSQLQDIVDSIQSSEGSTSGK